jgi:hypothetical protein
MTPKRTRRQVVVVDLSEPKWAELRTDLEDTSPISDEEMRELASDLGLKLK